jgi:hypothetical protein
MPASSDVDVFFSFSFAGDLDVDADPVPVAVGFIPPARRVGRRDRDRVGSHGQLWWCRGRAGATQARSLT